MKKTLLVATTLTSLLLAACGELPWDKKKAIAPNPASEQPNMGTISHENMRWPQRMVVLGDSIGAGLLGGSRMGGDLPAEYLKYFINGITGYSNTKLDLKGLGEVEKPFYSPFNGSRIAGNLHSRLASIMPNFSSMNASVPGANSWEIGSQFDSALRAQNDFDFTIMEFGHNDFCNPNSNIQLFRGYYDYHMSRVLQTNPRARILVVPLVNIPSLFRVAPDSATAVRLPLGIGAATANCAKVRSEMENACPTFRTREQEFPLWASVVTESAAAFQNKFPEARVVVAQELASASLITTDKIALDCFHPNRSGYESIANAAWESIRTSKIFSTLPR
jgi:lysophospholipase L1-like esterase